MRGFSRFDGGIGNSGNIVTKTVDYTAQRKDETILADASSNTVAISLPNNPRQGQIFTIKCIDATFACTIDRNGNNIDGAASDLNLALNVSRTLQYDRVFGWGMLC